MANNPKYTNLAVNTAVDALAALLNTGYLKCYDGTQPATADTAVSTQNILAQLRFSASAFGSSVAGVANSNTITGDTDADVTGNAAWFRCFKSDGTTAVMDGSIGTSGADININSVAIQIHAEVDCSGLSITLSKG
jgi:hypothetical protein